MSNEAVKASAAYQDSLQDMQTAMSGVKNSLVAAFLPGVTAVMDGVTEIIAGGEGGGKIQEGIDSLITTITASIPSVVEAGGQIVRGIGSAIIDNIPAVAAAGTEIIAQLLVALMAALPSIVEAGLNAVDVFAGGISASVPNLIPVAIDAVVMIADTLVAHAPELLGAALSIMLSLATGLIDALPHVIAKIPQIVSSMVDSFASLTPKIVDAGVSLLSALVRNLPAIISAVIAAAPQVVSSLVRAFSGLVPEMVSAGVNLIAGVGKGLIQGVGKVLSAAKDSAAQIVSGIKGFFGIHSPSVLMIEVGQMLDAGQAVGIQRYAHLVTDAAEALSADTIDALTPDISHERYGPSIGSRNSLDYSQPKDWETGLTAQIRGIATQSGTPAARTESEDMLAELVRLLRYILLLLEKEHPIEGRGNSDADLGLMAYYATQEAII